MANAFLCVGYTKLRMEKENGLMRSALLIVRFNIYPIHFKWNPNVLFSLLIDSIRIT